jgi:acyl-homoserine-lactone acylase
MYYEFGWAQMHNHANLVLRLYGQARGQAAAYWGDQYLASDKQVRLFQIPELAEKEYSRQQPAFRKWLDAFANGINAYATAHPDAISTENRQVLPVRGQDVLAHGIRIIFLRFVAGDNLGLPSRTGKAGSNGYAIGPSRTLSHHTLLLANPHLPWGDLYTFFEAHLQAPGFNAYGAAVVGLPVLNIAFNLHLGWTLTVNTIDACDRYELSLQGDGYILDDHTVPFEKKEVSLRIKQADGSLREERMECLYSRHGPVIGSQEGKAYAIRIAGMENPDILYQWHRMAAARDSKEFETALKMMQLPMFNVIYADDKGHILYLFDGNVPDRSEGDWKFWNGTVDGRFSKYIWDRTLPYEDLPRLWDPVTGFVQNANDPPWSCTYPALLDPGKYRLYISPSGMPLRPQRAVNMVRRDSFVTAERLAGYKLNTGMEAADRFLNDLLAAVQAYPDSLAAAAAAVLQKWDRMTDSDSRGAVLFARWFDKMTPEMFHTPWSPGDPLTTPAGLKDPRAAVHLLDLAAEEILKEDGRLDIAWGEVYRFRLNEMDYPANGGSAQYGIYRTIYYARDKDGKYRAVAGDSYVAITEFGKEVKAWVLLSYGNASQPGSKHAGDQLLLLSRKQLRTAWLGRKDILLNLEEKEIF